MTSKLEGFPSQILSIAVLSYLGAWEKLVFPFNYWALDKGSIIFMTVWHGPWLEIEPGTSHTGFQHSTTKLSRTRY